MVHKPECCWCRLEGRLGFSNAEEVVVGLKLWCDVVLGWDYCEGIYGNNPRFEEPQMSEDGGVCQS